jgi:hypothetical protein
VFVARRAGLEAFISGVMPPNMAATSIRLLRAAHDIQATGERALSDFAINPAIRRGREALINYLNSGTYNRPQRLGFDSDTATAILGHQAATNPAAAFGILKVIMLALATNFGQFTREAPGFYLNGAANIINEATPYIARGSRAVMARTRYNLRPNPPQRRL